MNTGNLIETGVVDHVKELKSVCYDLANNVIWGVSSVTDKINLISYFNHSAKPIIEFPNTHVKYMPCSMEKIINFSDSDVFLTALFVLEGTKSRSKIKWDFLYMFEWLNEI